MKNTLIVFALLLSGCASQEVIKTVTQTQYKAVTVPAEFTNKCYETPPPKHKDYSTLTYQEKENVLISYALSLHKDLDVCNDQIAKIKTLQAEQAKQYEALNVAP